MEAFGEGGIRWLDQQIIDIVHNEMLDKYVVVNFDYWHLIQGTLGAHTLAHSVAGDELECVLPLHRQRKMTQNLAQPV